MIILASASPARSQLLTQWGIKHQVVPTNLNEDDFKSSISDPKILVETLAQAKAKLITLNYPVLTADTIVVLNNQIIGKPTNRNDAQRIIGLLQGNTHQVWTGVCLDGAVFSDVASVTFKSMTNMEIDTYLSSNDWVGAAGAYRIQHAIKPHIAHIDGDINTIIGLPTRVIAALSQKGVSYIPKPPRL